LSKFKYHGQRFEVIFNKLPLNLANADGIIIQLINKIIQEAFHDTSPQERVWLVIDHECLDHPISLPYMMKKDLTTDLVLAAINIVTQSRKALKFDDQMIIRPLLIFQLEVDRKI
jgi:hypothetical protein